MEPKKISNEILIMASPATVWTILTDPNETKEYMFGCRTVSSWEPGAPLLWNALVNGKDHTYVKGWIVSIDPPRELQYTVIDPNSPMADIPENYLGVRYRLSAAGNNTMLTVTQDGFEHAADGEKRWLDVYNNGEGWNPLLKQVKAQAEAYRPA